jgi:hypothetical protein
VATIVACLAVFPANQVLAQTNVDFTDDCGVKCTYACDFDGTEYYARLDDVGADGVSYNNAFPQSLTKWVIPETITVGGIVYKVTGIHGAALSNSNYLISNALTEVVFPKYMTTVRCDWYDCFPNLRKITFGEKLQSLPTGGFSDLPLDTIIFLGTDVVEVRYGTEYHIDGNYPFRNCPTDVKVIIPCGSMDLFLKTFDGRHPDDYGYSMNWFYNNITPASFSEAECLNTLTVLSSDVALGNAISQNGSGQTLTTTTPNNTSTTHSGVATLYALPKVDKVFTGWADGNTDNPRTVTVSSDTTFTATFAECKETKVLKVGEEGAFKVYPNPTNSTLNVEMEQWSNGTFTLYDLSGKLVLSQSVNGNTAQINMSALSAGSYVLRLVENGKASVGVQVIKN